MSTNAKNYSAGGVADLTGLTGGTNLGTSGAGQFFAGNTFGSLWAAFAGSASDAGGSMAGASPGLIKAGMGAGLTYGRRSADIMALNLAGSGGLPQALSGASTAGAKSILGQAGKALSLGLEDSEKWALDAGLFGAEAIGCAIPQ